MIRPRALRNGQLSHDTSVLLGLVEGFIADERLARPEWQFHSLVHYYPSAKRWYAAYSGAAGIDVCTITQKRRFAVSLGPEVQGAKHCDETSGVVYFKNLRLGVDFPLSKGKTVSIGITQPIDDWVKNPMIVVDGDWLTFLGDGN